MRKYILILLLVFIDSVSQFSVDLKFRLDLLWFCLLFLDSKLPPFNKTVPDAITAVFCVKHGGHSIKQVFVLVQILLFPDIVKLETISDMLVFKDLACPDIFNELLQHTP